MSATQFAKDAATRLGVLEQAKALRDMSSTHRRRNRRDDRNLHLLLAGLLKPDSNCLDLGANVGGVLGRMVALAPEGHHIAVEAIPELAATLKDRYPSVEVHAVAVADEPGEAIFYVAADTGLSALHRRDWMGTSDATPIAVPVATVDTLIPEGRIVDFVKIDLEGAHVLALRGAPRLLEGSRPTIWLDHGHRSAAIHGTTTQDLWDLLQEHRYRLFTADGDGPLTWTEFSATDGQVIWTFIATPG